MGFSSFNIRTGTTTFTPVVNNEPLTYNPGGTTTVPIDVTQEYYAVTAITSGTTWAFTGSLTAGKLHTISLELTNGGSFVQIWPPSVTWLGGVAPTLQTSGVDILTFTTVDGGTTWRGRSEFVAGITNNDHGSMTGLADDDHTQYTLTSGLTRADITISDTPVTNDVLYWNGTKLALKTLTNTDVGAAAASHTHQIGDITGLSLNSVTESIAQAVHGFVVGDLIRHSGTVYAKSVADTAANSEVIGMVSAVANANNFTVAYAGRVSGLTGLTAGATYFLHQSVPGTMTSTEPIVGITKPVFMATSTTSGVFFHSRGLTL